jgi:hypothetical protein
MKKKNEPGSTSVPPPPIGLDEEQQFIWDKWPQWRLAFLNRRSKIKNTLIWNFLKINGPAIIIIIIVTLLLHYIFFPNFAITKEALSTLAIGILAASAAILTIIIAFLTFWFGSANNSMQKTRDTIRSELRSLETIKLDIEPYTAGPKEGLKKALTEKIQKLAQESESFLNALKTLSGRFYRAAPGTYYDPVELGTLDLAIRDTGGKWFKAYLTVSNEPSDHDFAKKTWKTAMDISRRIYELNGEVRRASEQLTQIIYFMPTLISVLFIFIASLVIAFMSGTNALQPLTGLILSFILVALLPAHLVITIRFLWNLVVSKYVTYEINRLSDIQYSNNVEMENPVDYTSALIRHAELFADLHNKGEDTTDSDSKQQS